MAAIDLAREYLSHVNGRDGESAAGLFTERGVVVDPAGHEHRGREAIAAFVEAAPRGTLARVAERAMGTGRAVLHGVVQSPGQPPDQVEWIFDVDGERIRRLQINSLESPAG